MRPQKDLKRRARALPFPLLFSSTLMPFAAVRCASCGTFQVQASKTVPRFTCTMCGEKQDLMRVYASAAKAKEVRAVVRELNLGRSAAYERGVAAAAAAAADAGGWHGEEHEEEEQQAPAVVAGSMWDGDEGGDHGGAQRTRWAAFASGGRGEGDDGRPEAPSPSRAAAAWRGGPPAAPVSHTVVTDLLARGRRGGGGGRGGGGKKRRWGGGEAGGPPPSPPAPPAVAPPPPPPRAARPLLPVQAPAHPAPAAASKWGGWCEAAAGPAPPPAAAPAPTAAAARWGAPAASAGPAAEPAPGWRVVTDLAPLAAGAGAEEGEA